MKELTVGYNEEGKRLDKLLGSVLRNCSKSFVYKMLRKKNIKLNDSRADGSEKLQIGDRIQIYFSDETYDKFTGTGDEFSLPDVPSDFRVIFQNRDYMIFHKWAGILSQKAKADDVSINEIMISYLIKNRIITKESLETFHPGVLNRLDRNTSGMLIGGITLSGSREISELIKNRKIRKYYLAVVLGEVKGNGRITGYISKDHENNMVTVTHTKTRENKEADIITDYETICSGKRASLLRADLITGRTHQIRASFAGTGHPVLGDRKYGGVKRDASLDHFYRGRALYLHAGELIFPDGTRYEDPLPDYFKEALEELGLKDLR